VTQAQQVKIAPARAIACGQWDSFALLKDGTVLSWGNNGTGQLGDGGKGDRVTPGAVKDLSGVALLSGGGWHALTQKTDGSLWSWGNNSNGQLGDNSLETRTAPVEVKG